MIAIPEGADQPGLNYSYEVRDEEDPVQSRLQGRKVLHPVEYQKVRFPGTADFQVHPVTDAIRERSAAYKGWKSGRAVGMPIEGLIGKPLGDAVVTREVVDELRHAGIATIEQLANVPDAVATFSARHTLRKLAAELLSSQAEAAQAETVARRDSEAETLRARVADLEAKLARFIESKEDPRV